VDDNIRIPRPTPDADIVAEAILREMARAKRWQTVGTAWEALLNIRRMYDSMLEEIKQQEGSYNSGTTEVGSKPNDNR
jgi:hypothetical protein